MKTRAEIMRNYRKRKAAGRAVFRFEGDLSETADALVAAGFLGEWDSDDRQKVQAALGDVLVLLTRPRDM